ncbi:hypothetical protein Taro_021349 [Colocasia esculenta]|uniref:Uncharacterized protein n=1 Tax=Colocasia esculenta TaxID=4460 RepID=A0A843UR65_COLES|nr:hypothetical protein [Colocasia esculenta]
MLTPSSSTSNPAETLIRLYSRTCNSNTRVRVSRSDDTDLDGTTQVPGQSPELTAWLTKNLGHPTGEVVTMCFNVSMELNGFVPYLRTR